jgi:hypothetical protein
MSRDSVGGTPLPTGMLSIRGAEGRRRPGMSYAGWAEGAETGWMLYDPSAMGQSSQAGGTEAWEAVALEPLQDSMFPCRFTLDLQSGAISHAPR